MPSIYNLEIYQGDDYAAIVTVEGEGGPIDLTGFSALAQIRRGPATDNPDVVVKFGAVVNPDGINLTIPHDITQDLDGRYVWDLQLTDPNGVVTTVLAGNVEVTSDVTRAL